eukprot:TRINITY_DN40738_c0_g1_i3.p1 TRINITY_DN40738_c0_g1~~TRINITY_DN40738_c0_g1_i3.p1  ORF type:complete len:107 (-),score=5.92 TRINITY_DN40738_c0_g1_i3:11-331(-)
MSSRRDDAYGSRLSVAPSRSPPPRPSVAPFPTSTSFTASPQFKGPTSTTFPKSFTVHSSLSCDNGRPSLPPPPPPKQTASGSASPEKIGRAVQQECRDRSRMPSSA